MKKRKFHPHPYLPEVIKDFRQDLFEWIAKMGVTEIECSRILGKHRAFVGYQRIDQQEPRISTILDCYAKMREYEQSKRSAK